MCCLLHFQQVVKLSSEVEEEDDTDHKALMEGYVSSFSTHHVTVFIIFFFLCPYSNWDVLFFAADHNHSTRRAIPYRGRCCALFRRVVTPSS